jgi:hypothetical protein
MATNRDENELVEITLSHFQEIKTESAHIYLTGAVSRP